METFTAVVKSVYASDKTRNVKVTAEDHYLAHKYAGEYYNELREEIVSIKDSKKNEVYNPEKGFLFE